MASWTDHDITLYVMQDHNDRQLDGLVAETVVINNDEENSTCSLSYDREEEKP